MSQAEESPGSIAPLSIFKLFVMGLVALVLVIALSIGGCAGCKSFHRSQARADANNKVKITNIQIRQAAQQVRVQRELALVKVAEAVGIRRSQDEINKTLTPLYVQHEAIQAQIQMSRSGTHTFSYIPSGNQGVPLVSALPGPSALTSTR